jgi:hypothetical protein
MEKSVQGSRERFGCMFSHSELVLFLRFMLFSLTFIPPLKIPFEQQSQKISHGQKIWSALPCTTNLPQFQRHENS